MKNRKMIYLDDAIDALERKKDKKANGDIGGFYNKIIQNDIDALMQLPPAQPEQRWIPCSERLPEGEYVLISKKPSPLSGSKWCVVIAIRIGDPRSGKVNWRDMGFGIIPDDKVLAWMPLPEPYRDCEWNGK